MQRIGDFRFFYEGEKWEWSDEVAALHGYAPGEVEPTTALMRRHKHPDDRAHFDAVLAEMLTNHAPFSSRHRIVDTSGRVRPRSRSSRIPSPTPRGGPSAPRASTST